MDELRNKSDNEKRIRLLLPLILGLYLLLTIGYGVVNPLFEAPDEHHHFYTVDFIARNGRLPIANLQEEQLRQEAAQPPLYYVMGGMLMRAIGVPETIDIWQNPYGRIGDASALTNINWGIHDAREAFPWQGYTLSVHLLRLFSTLLGLGTLLCIYAAGRLIWPQQPAIALLATALVAFLPQFNFLHSAVSNDTLIIFLCSAALWQLLRLWLTGVTNGRLLLLGVTVGLAILAKNAGTLLLLYSMGVLVLLWLRNDNQGQKHPFSQLFLFLIPTIGLGCWLWWRNWALYGDLTAANMFVAFAGGDRQANLWQVLREWQSIWPSLFAVFGWFNVRPPQWVYWVWDGIVLGGVLGFLLTYRQWRLEIKRPFLQNLAQRWFVALLLFGWVLAVYAGLVMFMLRTEAAQGRLLYPAILPLALGLAYGLSCWRWRVVQLVLPALALLTSLFALFFVIRPAYALPPTLAQLPETAVFLDADVGQGIRLLGVEIETNTAVPEDEVWLTLYWQATAPIVEPPQFTLELLGYNSERIGHVQGYHGRGLFPATLWPTEQIVADRFAFRVADDAQLPVLAILYAGLVDESPRITVGHIEVEPNRWPETDLPALTNLGDGIELTAMNSEPTAVSAGDTVTINVQWRVTQLQTMDYTTLIHLGEAGEPPLAVGDSPPLKARYPTRLWAAGELIDDHYMLTIPAALENGRYPLWIGMYDPQSFVRLPVFVDNEPQPNDVFQLGWITVTE